MKKHGLIALATICVLALFVVRATAEELVDRTKFKEEIKRELREEMKAEEGDAWSWIQEHIQFGGLIEFGGAWQDIDYADRSSEDESDLALTTVELAAEAEVNEWVNVDAILLYEDPTFENDETSVDLDVATVTIGNTERHPLYLTVGALYVPFGGLLTHFPDDPLVDQPLALVLGETREKAALLGLELNGFSLTGYLFNGDVDEAGEDNHIESYGFDANYAFDDEEGFDVLVGASYISNIADSDGLTDALDESGLHSVQDYVGGYDVYLHVGYAGFFIDGEYMTAADEFDPAEFASEGEGAQPAVWNVEVGYNLDWGKNLEIVLKYAGSDEAEALGFPEERYGICFNQEIFEPVIVSLGYLNDDYEDDDVDGRDSRDIVFGQIAVEF